MPATLERPIETKIRNAGGWPKKYSCRFIEPGLVHYDEYGTVLVRKEILDKMSKSFIGKPVINETHMDVTPEMFEDVADGVVTGVRYADDGWFWADFIVWDNPTQRNCESQAYSVSCAYDVTDFVSKEGEHNNIPYQQEVMAGEYTHLAIVANPRYEDARIVVYNSKGGSNMILKFWKKGKKDVKNAKEVDVAKAMVNVDNAEVPLSELIDVFKAEEAEKAKAKELGGENENLSEDTMIEIDGKETPIKNLIDVYRASKSKQNADDEEKKKKDEEEKAKAENAEAEEKKKKEDDEKSKADNENENENENENKSNENENENLCHECKKKMSAENSKDSICNECSSKGENHFDKLRKAANMRGEPQEIKVVSQRDRVEQGRLKYGTKK